MATIRPGMSLPTTNVWDASQVATVDLGSEEFRQLLVRLYQNINLIAVATNNKDTGIYDVFQTNCGQTYFSNPALTSATGASPIQRQVIRLVVNFGALPNNATKSVAHGIAPTASYTFTRIYATASDTTNKLYIPIPYATSTAADVIELSVDVTNVNIKTVSNKTAYAVCYVVLEYIMT